MNARHVAWGTEEGSAVFVGERSGVVHFGPDAEANAARANAEEQFLDTLRRAANFLYNHGAHEGCAAVEEALNRLAPTDDD